MNSQCDPAQAKAENSMYQTLLPFYNAAPVLCLFTAATCPAVFSRTAGSFAADCCVLTLFYYMLHSICDVCSWVSSSALFQAYVSYYDNGYLGHTAWAAAWLCKYSNAACPEAQRALTAALSSNLASNLGYDCEWLGGRPVFGILAQAYGSAADGPAWQ